MKHRMWAVRLAGAFLAVGGLWLGLTQPPPQDLTVEKIADDLHVIVGSGGNVAVLTTGDGVILVDDKFERNVPGILEKVKGITSQPVRYILNTHHHGDHTGGNQLLMKNAEIVAHRNARANIVKNSQPGAPQISFADEFALNLGGKEVRARHFGAGHTNGDIVVSFPAHKVVHTGDLFVRGTPFIDYGNGGNSEAWQKTLDGILSLEFDTLIPGHGALSKRADLAKWKADFATIRARVKEMAQQGKSKDDVARGLKVDDLQGWTLGGLFVKSIPGLYDEVSRR